MSVPTRESPTKKAEKKSMKKSKERKKEESILSTN